MKKQISLGPLQTLKADNPVIIRQYFYEPSEFLTALTLVPYTLGELKSGDIILVELKEEARFEATAQESDEKGNKILDKLDDGSYLIEIVSSSDSEIFYAAFDEYSDKYFLCPFTQDMIFGKALGRDLIFSRWELRQQAKPYEDRLYYSERAPGPDFSKLEIEYRLSEVSKDTEARTSIVWRFSANKTIYPHPAEFWLDALSYVHSTSLKIYFDEYIFYCPCAPLTETGIDKLSKKWLGEIAEISELLAPVRNNKRALLVGYYKGVASFAVETDEKWFCFFYHFDDYFYNQY